jgi:spore coat-associated protein N
MSMKKKLTMGAMSAALGLSLVAGGTWAAFNDIEEVSASFAAGTLNLTLANLVGDANNNTFKVSNLKPGDKMTRTIVLKNDGSLAMKDVLLSIDGINFNDYGYFEHGLGQRNFQEVYLGADSDIFGQNTALEYLDQFKVKVVNVGAQGGGGYPIDVILQDITLKDLYLATSLTTPYEVGATDADVAAARAKLGNTGPNPYVKNGYFDDNRIQVTPRPQDYSSTGLAEQYAGIPVGVEHRVAIEIEFNEYSTRDARGVEEQNKYQGDKVDVTFSLEGRQWDGQEVTASDVDATGNVWTNGKVNNNDSLAQLAGIISGPDLYVWSGDATGQTLQYNINFGNGVTLGNFSSAEVHFYDAAGNFLGKNKAKIAGILADYPNSAGLTGTVKGGVTTADDSSNPYWIKGAYSSTAVPAYAVFNLVKDGVEYSVRAD